MRKPVLPVDASLTSILACFAIPQPITLIEPIGHGLINDTYRIEAGTRPYVLQRINRSVFPKPEQIMANLLALAEHSKHPSDRRPRIPELVLTRDASSFMCDASHDIWRMMEFIPNTLTLSHLRTLDQAQDVGRLLGRFHAWTACLPIQRLGVSLPGFHSTPDYLAHYRRAIADSAQRHRSNDIARLADFVDTRRALAQRLHQALRSGQITSRITHGDPKLDNILFDAETGRARALIDLDTVQPGLIQHDLGDCLRSCCNLHGEGESEHDAIQFDLVICEGILAGYADETRGLLSKDEIAYVYDGIRSMPFELGLRFLTDHLQGNRYFKVERPGQNLVKAGIQFALLSDIERKEAAIRAMLERHFQPAR